MAFTFEIDAEQQLAVVRLSGVVTAAELLDVQQRLYTHPGWQAGLDEVWDGRAIRELHLSLEELREVVDQDAALSERIGHGRVAFVATRDLDRDVATLYTMIYADSPQDMRLFETLEEAMRWLKKRAPSGRYSRSRK